MLKMADLRLVGMNLGTSVRAYDFVDEGGQRRQGESKRLHVLVGREVLDIRVSDELWEGVRALEKDSQIEVAVSTPRNTRFSLVDAVEGSWGSR